MRRAATVLGCVTLTVALATIGVAEETAPTISDRLEQVSQGLAGRIGVAAQMIGGKEVVTLHGDETFPLASTYKVAIATTVLSRVDKGELSLGQLVEIKPDMLVAGDNVIAQNFLHPGIQLSVANLIEVMITESDNTAADICMGLAGGPAAVTEKLRSVGINDQRVDRPVAEGLKDFYQLPAPATATVVAEFFKNNPEKAAGWNNPNPDFEKDPRDHTTPLAMLELLLAIDGGKALSPASRGFLLATMSRTRTGDGRLRGLLPRATPVEHKTGTIGGVANDVGFVTLPDGRRFAIAVYTKSSETPAQDRDRAIAEITRTLFDYFLTQPPQ